MKGLIRNDFCKNIGLIITEDLVNTFNIDGTHGKKRMKNFKNVFAAIEGKKQNHCIQNINNQSFFFI